MRYLCSLKRFNFYSLKNTGGLRIKELYTIYKKCSGVSTDSRRIKPGDLYFSLRGDTYDGNAFAADALKKGAGFVVIDNPGYKKGDQYILVEDSLKTLQELARYHRQSYHIPVIGLTGSNGKTTTKELIKLVLSHQFDVFATEGNLNNHIGVPLTLLAMPEKTEVAIIEMGANHRGEIANSCSIAMPNHGLITNIGKAHIGEFGSFENIKKAKGELYDYLMQNNGKIFVNTDHALLTAMLKSYKKNRITYGSNIEGFCSGNILSDKVNLRFAFKSHHPKENIEVNTKIFGAYNFENFLAAACVGLYFNIDEYKIKYALESYESGNNRSQLVKTKNNLVYLDAYNANPSSMEKAITYFSQIEDKYKIMILGDMMEMGEYSSEEHHHVLELVRKNNMEQAIFVGNGFKEHQKNFPEFLFFPSQRELADWIAEHPLKGHRIYVKGSRALHLEDLLEYL